MVLLLRIDRHEQRTSSLVNERSDLKKFLKILHTLPSQSLHVNTRVLTFSNVQHGIGVGDLDTMFRSCHEVVEFGFVRRGGTCDRALMFVFEYFLQRSVC